MAGAEKQSAYSAAPTESARELDFFEEAGEHERSVDSKVPVGRTRVLFLNRSFWPDREATGQFLTELCDDLSMDHEVTVVAGAPCFTKKQKSPRPRLLSRRR